MNAYNNDTFRIVNTLSNIYNDIDIAKMLVKDDNPTDVVLATLERLYREVKRLDNAIKR